MVVTQDDGEEEFVPGADEVEDGARAVLPIEIISEVLAIGFAIAF
ncbi:MAG: hypothetical protein OXI30_15925 [Chloroflexota bacterium]|nr:hypothetical protein [Chloroflexota bacterium]